MIRTTIKSTPVSYSDDTHHHKNYKTLCRAEAFSGISTNLPTQDLATIRLNNLNSYNDFEKLGPIFPKNIFLVLNKRNEHHHQIPQIWITLGSKFHLKKI